MFEYTQHAMCSQKNGGDNCRSSQTTSSGLLGKNSGFCGSHFNAHTHVTLGKLSPVFCIGVVPALLGPHYGIDRGYVARRT